MRHVMGGLAILNDDRGGHAWGYVLPREGVVRKGLGYARGMGRKNFDALCEATVVIGHTRWATTGSKDLEKNAHPFTAGDVIGAHNGAVSNHSELNRKYGRDCLVDSHHIFLHLDEGKDVSELQAYGAITFTERTGRPTEVFLARFNRGELALARVPGYGWVWSSDDDHLKAALSLAGVPQADVVSPTENTLVSLTLEDGLVVVGDFEPSAPWRDPKGGRSYVHYADDDYDWGGYLGGRGYGSGNASYGCGWSRKSDDDKAATSAALATGTGPKAETAIAAQAQKAPAAAMSTMDRETSAAKTEIGEMLEQVQEALAHTTDEAVTREMEARAEKIEDLIFDMEYALEEIAAQGFPQHYLDEYRDDLDQDACMDYEEWLAEREAGGRVFDALADDDTDLEPQDRGRTLLDVLGEDGDDTALIVVE